MTSSTCAYPGVAAFFVLTTRFLSSQVKLKTQQQYPVPRRPTLVSQGWRLHAPLRCCCCCSRPRSRESQLQAVRHGGSWCERSRNARGRWAHAHSRVRPNSCPCRAQWVRRLDRHSLQGLGRPHVAAISKSHCLVHAREEAVVQRGGLVTHGNVRGGDASAQADSGAGSLKGHQDLARLQASLVRQHALRSFGVHTRRAASLRGKQVGRCRRERRRRRAGNRCEGNRCEQRRSWNTTRLCFELLRGTVS